MGLRVRLALVVLSLLAVLALAVPLALTIADRRTATLAAERDRQLAEFADAAAMPNAPLQYLVDRYRDLYGEGVLVVDADGSPKAATGLSIDRADVRAAADQALVDAQRRPWARIWPWDRHPVLLTAGVRSNGEVIGAVVLEADPAVAARDVGRAWLWLVMGGLAVILLAVLVARSMTRWVLRPIDGLERAVAEMTEGISAAPAGVAGPPELRHFTAAFNTMAQAVRAALDRQQRLVADASHQLRNPLAAVRLRADTLDENITEAGRKTYESMTAELDRLEHLLRQFLRLARAEEVSHSRRLGISETGLETTDIADVIDERIAFWQPVADGNGQRLRRDVPQPGPLVALARHEIEQLIDVAVDNALRYAGPDTEVTVSARAHGETVELIVTDNGVGLPPEDLPQATTRFWRGRRDRSGTGLGLAIAREIVVGHGGTVAVEAASEGGLSVRYVLPGTGTTA